MRKTLSAKSERLEPMLSYYSKLINELNKGDGDKLSKDLLVILKKFRTRSKGKKGATSLSAEFKN